MTKRKLIASSTRRPKGLIRRAFWYEWEEKITPGALVKRIRVARRRINEYDQLIESLDSYTWKRIKATYRQMYIDEFWRLHDALSKRLISGRRHKVVEEEL